MCGSHEGRVRFEADSASLWESVKCGCGNDIVTFLMSYRDFLSCDTEREKLVGIFSLTTDINKKNEYIEWYNM